MKICTDCGELKPLEAYRKKYTKSGGRYAYCKVCYQKKYGESHSRANKVWRDSNPEANKEIYTRAYKKQRSTELGKHTHRMAQVKHTYALTEDALQDMLLAQQGCCKVCGVDFGTCQITKGRLRAYHIDHDHSSGQVRGLLCAHCNAAIGYIEASGASANSIHKYLKRG